MTEDTDEEHSKLAADAEHEADDLKHQGDKLDEDIENTKADWERKKDDAAVPGAVPDPKDAD